MRKGTLKLATLVAVLTSIVSAQAAVTIVQNSTNVVGTGTNAWSYLIVEGEDYDSELNDAEGVGFTRVQGDAALTSFYGNPILATNTTASKKGALWTQPAAKHGDKVTYNLQFAIPGTYYLYMRFTMFENGGNPANYLNEDSFFVPPDFDKDPQNDWPLTDAGGQNGGYTEGCCSGAGYLFIPEKGGGGARVDFSKDTNYWEGNFHWNDLFSSQFLNPDTQGEPSVRRQYVVATNQIGKTLTWTISNREDGTAVDLWLFSTHPDLMDKYSQEELDQLLLNSGGSNNPGVSLTGSRVGKNVVISWPVSAAGYVLESVKTLPSTTWTAVTEAPVVVGDRNTLTVDPINGPSYYRLRKP